MKFAPFLFLAACTTVVVHKAPRVAFDAEATCDRAVVCGAKPDPTCATNMATLRVSPACASGVLTSSCDELNAVGGTLAQECFPPCEPHASQCNADGSVSVCLESNGAWSEVTVNCQDACKVQGLAGPATCDERNGASNCRCSP